MRRSLVANLPVQAPPGPAPIICARIKAALWQARPLSPPQRISAVTVFNCGIQQPGAIDLVLVSAGSRMARFGMERGAPSVRNRNPLTTRAQFEECLYRWGNWSSPTSFNKTSNFNKTSKKEILKEIRRYADGALASLFWEMS
jgi:hypothetical protein